MKLRVLIAMMVASFSLASHAGVLIEPYLGTGSYTSTVDADNFDDDPESYTTLGARLGGSFLLFSAGVDFGMDTFDGSTRSNTSAFVGFDFPILVRAYAKYMISSNLENDDLDDLNVDVAFNDGYVLGLGFTGLPLVSINLEIEKSSYTYEDYPILGDLDVDFAATTLTVSLPLDI